MKNITVNNYRLSIYAINGIAVLSVLDNGHVLMLLEITAGAHRISNVNRCKVLVY